MNRKRRLNLFIPVALLAGIGLAIYTSNKPWKVYQEEKAKANSMRSELENTQKIDAKLRAKDQLMSPVQKEEEARRLGYVLPEETSLPDKSANAPSATSSEPKAVKAKPEKTVPPVDLRGGDKNDEVQTMPQ